MTTKPQTIEEIVEEFRALGGNNYVLQSKVDVATLPPNNLLRDWGDYGIASYPENEYELDPVKVESWLRTKLQSLQDEKAEIIWEVLKVADEFGIAIWNHEDTTSNIQLIVEHFYKVVAGIAQSTE